MQTKSNAIGSDKRNTLKRKVADSNVLTQRNDNEPEQDEHVQNERAQDEHVQDEHAQDEHELGEPEQGGPEQDEPEQGEPEQKKRKVKNPYRHEGHTYHVNAFHGDTVYLECAEYVVLF